MLQKIRANLASKYQKPTQKIQALRQALENRWQIGTLKLILPNQKTWIIRGKQDAHQTATLVIHRWRAFWRAIQGGEIGLGEGYMHGDWHSAHLDQVLVLLALNEPYLLAGWSKFRVRHWFERWQHARRANTKTGAKRNIAAHYDLGNDFYAKWLDATWMYSSASFVDQDESLESAQTNKINDLLARAHVQAGQKILEIGSGWGSVAIACAQAGASVLSITLSEAQLVLARERAIEAGVAERIEFALCDYRDLTPAMHGQFDAVISCEMYEAVGEEWWQPYFNKVAEMLKPNGRFAFQGITIAAERFDAYRQSSDFIRAYVFPGGMLAPWENLQALATTAGLALPNGEAIWWGAADYDQTLGAWAKAVKNHHQAIIAQYDLRFYHLWEYYLAACQAVFRLEATNVVRLAWVKSEIQ